MESLFLSIIVAKYLNILPRANNGRLREKKKILAKLFARAIRVHYRDSKHAYIYWIWLRGSASYVIIDVMFDRLSVLKFVGIWKKKKNVRVPYGKRL